MDCHRPSAFAMTKGGKGRWFLFLFCFCINFLWFVDCHSFYEVSQWRMGQGVVFTNSSLRELLLQLVAISVWQKPHLAHTVIARTEGSWQSWYDNHHIVLIIELNNNTQPPCDFVASPLTKGGNVPTLSL